MDWLGRFRIPMSAGAVIIATGLIVLCYWQFRRGRGDAWRRYIPGFMLINLGALASLARILFHSPPPAPPTFSAVGLLAFGLAVIGTFLVLREERRRRANKGRYPE